VIAVICIFRNEFLHEVLFRSKRGTVKRLSQIKVGIKLQRRLSAM
jgi:hypothetical protein